METSTWGKHGPWHCEIQLLRIMFFPPLFTIFFTFRQNIIANDRCKMIHIRTHIYDKHLHVQIIPKQCSYKRNNQDHLHYIFPPIEYVQIAFLQYFKSFHIIPTIRPPSAKSARKRPPGTRQHSCHRTHLFPNISKVDFQKVRNLSRYNCHWCHRKNNHMLESNHRQCVNPGF